MKWSRYKAMAILLSVLTVSLSADEPQKPKQDEPQDASVWMRMKLDYSKNILEGITKGEFELVEDNALKLRGFNRVERFVRGKWEGYSQQLQAFQHANDDLIKQARKKNVEGATLAFTQLTISCVNCHKKLREEVK